MATTGTGETRASGAVEYDPMVGVRGLAASVASRAVERGDDLATYELSSFDVDFLRVQAPGQVPGMRADDVQRLVVAEVRRYPERNAALDAMSDDEVRRAMGVA